MDDFTRADNEDIDADTSGMSGMLAPLSYIEVGDTNLSLPGLTNIAGNALSLADGPNMSVFHLDRNFVSDTTTNISVSLDLLSNDGNADQLGERFVGVGFGATQSEAEGAAFDHNAAATSPAWKGHQNGTTDGSGFADFFVAWERTGGDPDTAGQIAIWRNGIKGMVFDNAGAFYEIGSTLTVGLSFADFSAGSTVTADITYGDVALGTETFTWDNTNQNYIGIAARQNQQGWSVDNLMIEANAFVPEPQLNALWIVIGLAIFHRSRRR
ncbi:MAG: hypothetical protein AAF497_17840 [Planctomycetota bacterium]